jgi:hypothetical protein
MAPASAAAVVAFASAVAGVARVAVVALLALAVGASGQPMCVTGWAGDIGDTGFPANAFWNLPHNIVWENGTDGQFVLTIADAGLSRIRRMTPTSVTTIAGTGVAGFSGDGGMAKEAMINAGYTVAAVPASCSGGGGYVYADRANNRLRRMWPNGTISTVMGTGTAGSLGDLGPATSAQLNLPRGVSVLPSCDFLIAGASAARGVGWKGGGGRV